MGREHYSRQEGTEEIQGCNDTGQMPPDKRKGELCLACTFSPLTSAAASHSEVPT